MDPCRPIEVKKTVDIFEFSIFSRMFLGWEFTPCSANPSKFSVNILGEKTQVEGVDLTRLIELSSTLREKYTISLRLRKVNVVSLD